MAAGATLDEKDPGVNPGDKGGNVDRRRRG
jgi:hypothetical protein